MFHIDESIRAKALKVAKEMLEDGKKVSTFSVGDKNSVSITTKRELVLVLDTFEMQGQTVFIGIGRDN